MNLFELSVKIGADTSQAEKGMKSTQGVSETLTNKIKVLSAQFEAAQKNVDKLAKEFNESVNKAGATDKATQELANKLADAEKKAGKFAKELDAVQKEAEKFAKELDAVQEEAEQSEKALDGCNEEIEDTGKKAEKSENSLANFAGKLGKGLAAAAKIGIAAVSAAGSGIVALGTYAANVGGEFEAQMSKVSAISGATGDDLQALEDKAKQLGIDTKFSATEAGQAFEYMAMAGWKTEQMLDGVAGIMDLAAASGEDLASVSDIVTDAMTAFGLSADQSTHFADVLAKASSNANTNVGLMGETFKYVAPVAGAMGYSIEDTAVAIGLMANAGIKGSQAGTALRGMLARLAKPTDEVSWAMEQLDISLSNADGTMKDFDELLLDLRERFADLGEAERTEMAALLAGQEAMSGLLSIVSASDADFNKLTEAINNADGASKQMADTMSNNLQGQLTLMKSSAEGFGLAIYEKMQVPLTNLSKEGITAINSLTEGFREGGVEGMIAAAGEIVGKLLTGIAENAPKLIESGADLLISIIDGLVSEDNAEGLAEAALNIIETLSRKLIELAGVLGEAAFELVGALGDELSERIPGLSWVFENLEAVIVGVTTALATLKITMAMSALIDGLTKAWQAYKTANEGATVAQWLLNAAQNANPMMLVISLVAGLVAAIITLWNTNDGFKDAIIGAWDAIKGAFSSAWDSIVNLWNGAGDFFSDIWTDIQNAFGSVADWFNDIFSKAWEGVKNVFSSGGKIFQGITDGISGAFKTVVNAIIKGINNVVAWPFDKINGFLNKIRNVSFLGISPFKGFWKQNPLPVPQIPLLARGGVLGKGQIGILEGTGAEAVVPLENNQKWISKVADDLKKSVGGFGGNVYNVEINIDGAKYSDEQSLARAVAEAIQGMSDRRAAVYA